jgi:uncharacterized membrane protein
MTRESDETDRLPALSDGVIAIAITLLVLDLAVPAVPPASGSAAERLQALVGDQWEALLGYVVSFLVIGQYWKLHRHVFTHIDTHDKGVLWLNLLFLLFVALVPFATSVFSTYPDQLGVTVMGSVLALTGLSLAVLWIYASRKELLEAGLTSRVVGIQATRFLAPPLVFLLSVAVAFVNPTWGILMWGLLVPVTAALDSRLVAGAEAAAEAADA